MDISQKKNKMKKTIIAALISLCCAYSNATQILWVGIDENAKVHLSDQTVSIVDWIALLGNSPSYVDPVDVGGRIRIGDTALLAGYEDPPDQNPPAVSFDDEITEFGLVLVDDNDEPTGMYADWQPIKLPEEITKSHTPIYYDIGYCDANADWEFVTIATAIGFVDELWDNHTYIAGTLAPPTETPWRPNNFYAVPEPSTTLLALLGIGMLLKRRK